jgi:hypothetical protein
MDRPLREPPNMLKDTCERSGRTISASPANALETSRRNIMPSEDNIDTGLNLLMKLICNLLTKYLVHLKYLCPNLVVYFHLLDKDFLYFKTFFLAMSNNL